MDKIKTENLSDINIYEARDLASEIIDETKGAAETDSFFIKMEKCLLQACILFAADENNDAIKPSVKGIYDYVSTHTSEQLCADFNELPDIHPAKGPYNVYRSSGKTVMNNSLLGLAIRLANPYAYKTA